MNKTLFGDHVLGQLQKDFYDADCIDLD